jgi:hypothetical protein
MSVIKSFAHRAHQSLSPLAPSSFKRSHVYELMAAGLGFKSWASLHSAHVLIDGQGVQLPADFGRNVLARALQLGLSQTKAEAVAKSFHAQCAQKPFGCLALTKLDESLFSSPSRADADLEWDEDNFDNDDEDWSDESGGSEKLSTPKSSQVLIDDLADRASQGDVRSHYRLAKLLACKVPSDYLYQESLKGRALTAQEQIWVDQYLQLVPQREKYLQHLQAAADGGIRAANLEYAMEANAPSYRERAVNMTGDIDWRALAETATSHEERNRWLREAAGDGDDSALEELAQEGDSSAAEQLALWGDQHWLREVTELAIEQGDPIAAWKWHFVALHYELDLTKSTMRAYHHGGSNAGEFYDSDFGGAMYVAGNEGLELPKIRDGQKSIAKAMAEQLLSGSAD